MTREDKKDDLLEGTSARTRPFSFDEIMQGRKNRENDVNHTSTDPQEESFRRKEDSNVTGKNRKLVQDNHSRGSQQPDTESRRIEENNANSNRTTNEKYHHSDWRKRDDSGYGDGKRQASDTDKKDHVSERRRIKSEITRPAGYGDNRVGEGKRMNEKKINSDYEYKRRNERDEIKTDKLAGRGVNKSEVTRGEDYRDNRVVDGKRMSDKRINSDYEYKRRNEKDEIKTDKLAGRGGDKSDIARGVDYRDHRPVDRKRKNDERLNINYEYKKRNENDKIKTDRLTRRGGDESETTRTEDHRGHRLVDRKRKNEERLSNDYRKRNEKDAIKTEKLTSRGGDKAEKENKHKSHTKEEDKARGISSGEKHGVSENKVPEPARPVFESRPKRRHSHSRERAKERGGRSRSHSPKAHKHTHKGRKEPVKISSHSMKDKTERESSDVVDKKRASHNESVTHYRRNSGPSSGLGGYSPRKRKAGAGTKTPSPIRRSPERRNAGWDLQPVESTGIGGGPDLANLLSTNQNLSWKINETSNITPVMPLSVSPIGNTYQNLVSQMQAIESVQLTEATRPMRRLYVENVPTSVSDKDLIECINRCLLASGSIHIQGTQPCLSCIIHREKAQALLEFLTPEDASAAVSLDSISISGTSIKLRRPKDFSTTTGILEKSVSTVGSPSDIVEDSPNKIFIGRIPKLISSHMLLEIARIFGAVKAYHYESNTEINESCAFLEYVDHSVSPKACAGLNGMRLGGQVITAVFASPDALLENTGPAPCYGIPEHAKPLLEKPTTVLKLKNVLDPGSLVSFSELDVQEILEDVRLECSRFGTVKSVNVSKQNNSPVPSEAREADDTNASIDNNNGEKNPDVNRSEFFGHSSFDEATASHNTKGEEYQPHSDENISGLNEATTREKLESNECEDSKFEGTRNPEAVGPFDVRKNDGSKNLNAPEEGDIFEPGSVFVEFKRAEAACVAAHSLHGRAFDGRIVAAEYVDHDIYTRRFRGG